MKFWPRQKWFDPPEGPFLVALGHILALDIPNTRLFHSHPNQPRSDINKKFDKNFENVVQSKQPNKKNKGSLLELCLRVKG